MLMEASESSSEDMSRSWALLRRMLDTAHLPLVNASGRMWTKFDHLRMALRGAVALEGSSLHAEKMQPLVEMIEEVDRMRPAAGDRAEGTGNWFHSVDSVIQDARQPAGHLTLVQQESRGFASEPRDRKLLESDPFPSRHSCYQNGSIPPPPVLGSHTSTQIPIPWVMASLQCLRFLPRSLDPALESHSLTPRIPRVHPFGVSSSHIPGMSGPRRAIPLMPLISQFTEMRSQ